MGATGTVIVDFGATPVSDAFAVVIGQGTILAGSLVEAWVSPVVTADHTADEHLAEDLDPYAGNIVAGVGFTVWLISRGPNGAFGKFTVNWVWV